MEEVKNNIPFEIEKIEVDNFLSEAKTFRGLLISFINKAKKDKLILTKVEARFLLEELLGHYDKFNPSKVEVRLPGWKGKSSIKFIELPDSFDIITYQKPDQDSEAKEIKTNIHKDEINNVIEAVNTCPYRTDKKGNRYKHSVDIAERFCHVAKIALDKKGNALFPNNLFEYSLFFGDRRLHKNLNLSLRLLDYFKVIRYRGKRSVILNNNFKFQLVI